jgi:hypothetical protein
LLISDKHKMDNNEGSLSPPAKKKLKVDENVLEKPIEGLESARNESKNEKTREDSMQSVDAVQPDDSDVLPGKTEENTPAEPVSVPADELDCGQKGTESTTVKNDSGKSKIENTPDLQTRILETDVGIQEYISSCKGFQAVIKQRLEYLG